MVYYMFSFHLNGNNILLRWGFSPWTKLSGDRILVVGAGDPRHLVTTLAGNTGNTGDTSDTFTTGNVTEFFLLEQNLHVYCRQVSGTIKFGISCKLVNVFIDVVATSSK